MPPKRGDDWRLLALDDSLEFLTNVDDMVFQPSPAGAASPTKWKRKATEPPADSGSVTRSTNQTSPSLTAVHPDGTVSEPFKSLMGILTGDSTSPILWDLYCADLTGIVTDDVDGVNCLSR
ncbi:hypothetical protein BDZ89DRAFT_1161198 [Hymenopellis radicata]|nr:hypothetical protein BDZ89DRAFT_1161198 [Hymenopellis radicata]